MKIRREKRDENFVVSLYNLCTNVEFRLCTRSAPVCLPNAISASYVRVEKKNSGGHGF